MKRRVTYLRAACNPGGSAVRPAACDDKATRAAAPRRYFSGFIHVSSCCSCGDRDRIKVCEKAGAVSTDCTTVSAMNPLSIHVSVRVLPHYRLPSLILVPTTLLHAFLPPCSLRCTQKKVESSTESRIELSHPNLKPWRLQSSAWGWMRIR